jgi:hypothetical protein
VSRIVVIDVDPRNGGDASLAELERTHRPFPVTVSVATGGNGRHLYFVAPDEPIPSGDLADGVELKAEGRYVIAPPSIHPSGKEYRWENHPPKVPLAQCPEWVRVPPKSKARPAKAEAVAEGAADAGSTPLGRAFAAQGMPGRLLA